MSQTTTADSYNLEEVEKSLIQKAIQKSSGNISKAAKELGSNQSQPLPKAGKAWTITNLSSTYY